MGGGSRVGFEIILAISCVEPSSTYIIYFTKKLLPWLMYSMHKFSAVCIDVHVKQASRKDYQTFIEANQTIAN